MGKRRVKNMKGYIMKVRGYDDDYANNSHERKT